MPKKAKSWDHTIRRLTTSRPSDYCSAVTRLPKRGEPARVRGCDGSAEYGCSYVFLLKDFTERRAERTYCERHARRFAERWHLPWPFSGALSRRSRERDSVNAQSNIQEAIGRGLLPDDGGGHA